MFSYQYAYLLGIDLLMYFPVFFFLFFWRNDLRKEMLIAGSIFGVIAFLTEPIFIKYYWHPEYIWPLFIKGTQIGSFEDFVYGFLKGGIAAVIYEEVFCKTVCKMRKNKYHFKRMIIPIYLSGILIFIFATVSLQMNPIYSSLLSTLVFFIYLLIYRRDLLSNALCSGILVASITYVGYILVLIFFPNIFEIWWKVDALSGIEISRIPIEELLEGFLVGFFGGPFYEFFNGLKLKQYRGSK